MRPVTCQVAPGHGRPARLAEDELSVDERPLLEAIARNPIPENGPAVIGAPRGVALAQVGLHVEGVPALTVAADPLYLGIPDECFAGFTESWYPPVVVSATRIVARAETV